MSDPSYVEPAIGFSAQLEAQGAISLLLPGRWIRVAAYCKTGARCSLDGKASRVACSLEFFEVAFNTHPQTFRR